MSYHALFFEEKFMRLKDVKNRKDLAQLLDVKVKVLTYCLYVLPETMRYSSFVIPKKDGSERQILVPCAQLKRIQKKLAEVLNEDYLEINSNNVAQGFIKNKGIITNARYHRNKRVIINVDISDFFGTIHFGRVKGYFENNKFYKLNNKVATMIAQLTCYQGKLPQGAPTSPVIANMIGQIIDYHILKLCKKYKLYYTRYADDMTFSTNINYSLVEIEKFICDLSETLSRLGFEINTKKTRVCFNSSKQEVTGVIVNKKLNADKTFIKETRAMAQNLYSTGGFVIDNKIGTMDQLEGRFAFINQFDKYNNIVNNTSKGKHLELLNVREKAYQQFLFYKLFLGNDRPVIYTEGKTDSRYIKAALKKLYIQYDDLIEKNENGKFEYKILFGSRNKKYEYFLNFMQYGADSFNTIALLYTGRNGYANLCSILKSKMRRKPNAPVILLMDNEQTNGKPLNKFLQSYRDEHYKNLTDHEKAFFNDYNYIRLVENLYLATFPLEPGVEEMEIEDLFSKEFLDGKINGKSFKRSPKKGETNVMSKDELSRYVLSHYRSIDFSGFKGLLDVISAIKKDYEKYINMDDNKWY